MEGEERIAFAGSRCSSHGKHIARLVNGDGEPAVLQMFNGVCANQILTPGRTRATEQIQGDLKYYGKMGLREGMVVHGNILSGEQFKEQTSVSPGRGYEVE